MFRGINIPNSDGENIEISFRKVKDIFKFGDKPYLCVAKSGGGKTTLCLDVMYQFAKDASRVYYISATQNNLNEESLNQIPEVFRRPPTFDSINRIWEEITNSNDSFNRDIDSLLILLGKIYPKNEINIINSTLEQQEQQLTSELRSREFKLSEIKDSILGWKVEVITRLLLNGVDKYGTQNPSINEQDIDTLNSLVTDKQRTLLFIDDVSSELLKMSTSKNKVYYKGNPTPEGQAYKALLTDIMTRARHTDSIIIIFVHTWNTIDVKNNIDNFIVLDSNSAGAVKSYRSLPENVKTIVPQVGNSVFEDYPYHFVVSKNSGTDVCVSKADLHDDEIEFDRLNSKLIEVYDSITKNKTENVLEDSLSDDLLI